MATALLGPLDKPKNRSDCDDWIKREPGRIERCQAYFREHWHNTTLRGLIAYGIRTACKVVLAGTPGVLAYLKFEPKGPPESLIVLAIAAAGAAAAGYIEIYDRRKANRSPADHHLLSLNEVLGKLRHAVGQIDGIKANATEADRVRLVEVRNCLAEAIAKAARLHLGVFKQDVRTNLFEFVTSDGSMMKATGRSHPDRSNEAFPGPGRLPYHAALNLRMVSIPNRKSAVPFDKYPGCDSPGSKLAIPLIDYGDTTSCTAVVVIESPIPYHFTPAVQQAIYPALLGYFALFRLILGNPNNRLIIKGTTNGERGHENSK